MKPFEQGRFEDLPELPPKPHVFWQSEGLDLRLNSEVFGSMNVHVRKMGVGPPLLLVHGLMTSSYSWRYALTELSQHYTCYAPDLPGAGRSDGPLEPKYTPANLATWLVELMRALSIEGCPVIGNSMGGYIAMQLALDHPRALSRLINVHSPGVPEPKMFALRWLLNIPGSLRLLQRLVHKDVLRWAHKNVHYYDESLKSLEEAHEYGEPLKTKEGVQVLFKYLAETMDVRAMHSFHEVLGARQPEAFPVPLLLLYAEQDPLVPPKHGLTFHQKIKGSQFVQIAEASHFAHVDAVERFLPPVLEFLAKP